MDRMEARGRTETIMPRPKVRVPHEPNIIWKFPELAREIGVSEPTLRRWIAISRVSIPKCGVRGDTSPAFMFRSQVALFLERVVQCLPRNSVGRRNASRALARVSAIEVTPDGHV